MSSEPRAGMNLDPELLAAYIDQRLTPEQRAAVEAQLAKDPDSYAVLVESMKTVDALAEVTWSNWRFALNVTNLLDNQYFASCLARGDCFTGAPRNVVATVGYRF